MEQAIKITANVQWTYALDPESNRWIGVCEPLQLTVEGETQAILMESITETMDALMHDVWETGDLTEFLRRHGWAMESDIPARPDDGKDYWFDVPIDLIAQAQNDSARKVYQ